MKLCVEIFRWFCKEKGSGGYSSCCGQEKHKAGGDLLRESVLLPFSIISIFSFLFFASSPRFFFLISSRYLGNGGPPQFDCQHHSTVFASFFVSFTMARQDQSSNKSSAFASFHFADVISISFFFFCFQFRGKKKIKQFASVCDILVQSVDLCL